MNPLKELIDVVGRGLQRFGDGLAAAGAKLGDMFHELGEQLRRNMCATPPGSPQPCELACCRSAFAEPPYRPTLSTKLSCIAAAWWAARLDCVRHEFQKAGMPRAARPVVQCWRAEKLRFACSQCRASPYGFPML